MQIKKIVKQAALLIFLTCSCLSFSEAHWQNKKQREPKPASPAVGIAKRGDLIDAEGKRVTGKYSHAAEIVMPDGKIKAFRRNKKEINLLIDELKARGITEARLIDAQFWATAVCDMNSSGQCGGYCNPPNNKGTCQKVRYNPGPHASARQSGGGYMEACECR